jgi:hypothetical protein
MRLIAVALVGLIVGLVIGPDIRVVAQTSTGEIRMQFVPATNTDIIVVAPPLGYLIKRITLSNTSAAQVTCNVRDRSTNCGGAACQFWPNIQLDANTLQMMDFDSMTAIGGLSWSCSTGSVVVGSIQGRQ